MGKFEYLIIHVERNNLNRHYSSTSLNVTPHYFYYKSIKIHRSMLKDFAQNLITRFDDQLQLNNSWFKFFYHNFCQMKVCINNRSVKHNRRNRILASLRNFCETVFIWYFNHWRYKHFGIKIKAAVEKINQEKNIAVASRKIWKKTSFKFLQNNLLYLKKW